LTGADGSSGDRYASLRRLAIFAFAVVAMQYFPFAALTPLLPHFEETLGLSKAQSGLLAGMFPAGMCAVALPTGLLASKVDSRRLAIAGLLSLAVTNVGFGIASSYGPLLATRFLQGAAAGLCFTSVIAWLVVAAPRERRGEMIGLSTAGAAAGQVVGPLFGGAAVVGDRIVVFALLAAGAVALAIVCRRFPAPAKGDPQPLSLIRDAHATPAVLGGLWLILVPGLLLGTLLGLLPLQLDRVGWGPVGVSATFVVAGCVGVLARPLVGRWADRRGLVSALRVLLLASIPITVVMPRLTDRWALAAICVVAVTTYGVMLSPAMALVSHQYEAVGIAQMFGFALMGLASGIGFFLGSTVAGEVAHAASDTAAFALMAGITVATLVAVTVRGREPAARLAEPS
jgi:predicted MFS family arabinose efflux permease